ncbi:MAG: ABC transporter permease [Thermoplasmata archaeon]
MNGRRIWADFLVFSRGYFRNIAALFFSLFFPIILIVLFGLIFSNSGNTTPTIYAENMDHGSNVSSHFLDALNKTGAIRVDVVAPGENFSQWLVANGHTVGLVIPAGFQSSYLNGTPIAVTAFVDPQDPGGSGLLLGALQGVGSQFNLQAAGGHTIIYTSTENVGSSVYTYIDYLVPGLIGFSILTSPMFSMVDISSNYRKEHLFRQLSLTPLTRGEWLTSKIVWFVVLSFVSAVIMLGVGVGAFGAHLTLDWQMLPFLVAGPFFFVSLGMLAGSVARTPESAAIIGNVITFPMMFLAGTFFPVSNFPTFLQVFAHILPLYYIIDGMNQVMLFGNFARAGVDLAIIAVAGVIVFLAAITVFKWRDE